MIVFRSSTLGTQPKTERILSALAISSAGSPEISIVVTGTDAIRKIEITKNNQVVKDFLPGAMNYDLSWTDKEFGENESCFYYVRIIQENNEEAISSPVWVNTK